DGAAGLYVGYPDRRARHYPAFPAPVVVDSTGAGDVFRAGVLYGLSTGCDMGDALAFGSAAASLKVGSLGGNEGIPTREEVEAHLAAHPAIAGAYRL
ncbi:carbohydrate kinase family protein, partial [bacterium]